MKAQVCFIPALIVGKPTEMKSGTPTERSPARFVIADDRTWKGLQEFSDEHGRTMVNVLQLTWALILSRYKVCMEGWFGYLTGGRDVPVDGVEELVGPLINIVMTHIKLDPKMGI